MLGRLCRIPLCRFADTVQLSCPLCRRHHFLAGLRGELPVGGRYRVSMLVFEEVIGVDGFLHFRFDKRHIGPVRAALKGVQTLRLLLQHFLPNEDEPLDLLAEVVSSL